MQVKELGAAVVARERDPSKKPSACTGKPRNPCLPRGRKSTLKQDLSKDVCLFGWTSAGSPNLGAHGNSTGDVQVGFLLVRDSTSATQASEHCWNMLVDHVDWWTAA